MYGLKVDFKSGFNVEIRSAFIATWVFRSHLPFLLRKFATLPIASIGLFKISLSESCVSILILDYLLAELLL